MSDVLSVERTDLDGVLVVTPKVLRDERGAFSEIYNKEAFDAAVDAPVTFVQDNESISVEGVLRGIHYQLPPYAQGKLVRVANGSVFDVAVDLRRSSPSFGRWVGRHLDASDGAQMWIPPGFGHGFLALSERCHVVYKVTAPYAPASDRVVRWDDPLLAIAWPLNGGAPIVSEKDASAPDLSSAQVFD
jgi:dTDP-4-dehydrorhamnose 3,5-epimerase